MSRGGGTWALTFWLIHLLLMPASSAGGFVPEASLAILAPTLDSCPTGMARVDAFWGSFCIDRYEAIQSANDIPVSVAGMRPWTNVTWEGARLACGRAGKRLCTDREWMAACDLQGKKYDLTDEESSERYECHTACPSCSSDDDGTHDTGAHPGCRSSLDVYDMVGNVLEWTDGTVPDRAWGYGLQAVGTVLGEDPARFGDDAIRPPAQGGGERNHFLRGGSWDGAALHPSQHSGCFSLDYSDMTPDMRYGFRCCKGPDESPPHDGTIADVLIDRNRLFIDTMEKGVAYCRVGAFEDALTAFDDAIVIAQGNAEAGNARSVVLAGMMRMDEALEAVNGVLDSRPSHRHALANKGLFFVKMGRYQEAVDTYDKLLALYPEDENAAGNRAYAQSMVAEDEPSPTPGPSPTTPPSTTTPVATTLASPTPAAIVTPSLMPSPIAPPSPTPPRTTTTPKPLSCPTGLTPCKDLCVDLAIDPFHCGSCLWSCREEQTCVGGICVNPEQVPERVSGALREACDDGRPCTIDVGFKPACEHIPADCGYSCGPGKVCDGDGGCVSLVKEREPCGCPSMCAEGLKCASDVCARASSSCGDMECNPGECHSCPEDCTLESCAGNEVCDSRIGEDCATTPGDCLCAPGFVCRPSDEGTLRDGCRKVTCGDGWCDPPETAVDCCIDCPCSPDSLCDNHTQTCVLVCGNGRCDPGECDTCPGDCTCSECRCEAEIIIKEEIEMKEGVMRVLTVGVRNTGHLNETFQVSVDVPFMPGLPHEHSLTLEPDGGDSVNIMLRPRRAGRFRITVRVTPEGAGRTTERTVSVQVKARGFVERVFGEGASLPRAAYIILVLLIAVSFLVFMQRSSSTWRL